jgi:hypothetical protein
MVDSIIKETGEKSRTLINNFFAKYFPSKFKIRKTKYIGGTINRFATEFDAFEKNLSVDDKRVILNLLQKLSTAKREIFERQEWILTKDKIDYKFIEDVLDRFKGLLALKNINEKKWHDFFKDNPFIFSQLFAFPTVLFKDKAYVGGKTIEDESGKIVDFLYANRLTRNSVLIEIKTHTTKLLNKRPYRGSDVFNMAKNLSGAINQVLDQKETYCKKFDAIRRSEDDVTSFNPRCIIIIGRVKSLNKRQLKAFELIRSSLKDIEIIAFDELYVRIKAILNIFKKDDSKRS